MGAGHVNPSRAVDPGLVYDLGVNDYISYLCGLGTGDAAVSAVVHRSVNCSLVGSISEAELNYPALVINARSGPVTVNRTVTNVGSAKSRYACSCGIYAKRNQSDSAATDFALFRCQPKEEFCSDGVISRQFWYCRCRRKFDVGLHQPCCEEPHCHPCYHLETVVRRSVLGHAYPWKIFKVEHQVSHRTLMVEFLLLCYFGSTV